MSCKVTTIDSNSLHSVSIGVELTRTATDRPSGTDRTISSARSVSLPLRTCAKGNCSRDTSRPSSRLNVRVFRSSLSVCPGLRTASTILRPSRLKDPSSPVRASRTATPTGEVSMSVCRPALARCSSRYRRALEMTSAAWAANMTRVSSSSWVNSGLSNPRAKKMLPIPSPW